MDQLLLPDQINMLKDVSIGLVAMLILGKIMLTLAQAATEFLKSLSEDIKERNKQFETLLGINMAIAHQVELTRQAIERQTDVDEKQSQHLSDLTTAIAGLQTQGKQMSQAEMLS